MNLDDRQNSSHVFHDTGQDQALLLVIQQDANSISVHSKVFYENTGVVSLKPRLSDLGSPMSTDAVCEPSASVFYSVQSCDT